MSHFIEVRYSNDGGNNWSNWRLLDTGDTGSFLKELVTRRLGFCKHRIWEIRDTSDTAASLLSAALYIDGEWRKFPLPDGSYSDSTRPWSQQDVCDYLPTFAESAGTSSEIKHETAPGLQAFANVGDGPHRGARDVEGKLFVVSGNKLFQVAPDGTATERGTIPGTGRVSITHNQIDGGNQVVIGSRDNTYVWSTVTNTLTATGVGLLSVDFLNQYVLGVDPARRFWRWSGLADALTYSTIDNESAESSPDRIVGGIVSQGEWLVFGERTTEVWTNSPSQDATFVRSVVIERGCRNANTLCRLDNSVFFVDNNGIPCRLQGYSPVPIAPKAIIDEISSCDPTKLFAFTWEDKGYVVYYITAQDGRTWGYDVTSQKWHRRESFGLDRWRLNTLFKWNGDWYGGDYQNGKLYRLAWGYVFEGCELMPRRIRSGVLHNNGNRVFVHGLRLNVATGGEPTVVSDTNPATIMGNLPDGAVGDPVSFQYTITRAFPGQVVTLTVNGALPTGLSMDADGLVTGTLSEAGGFSWTITPTTDCADGVALSDSATVEEIPAGIRPRVVSWWDLESNLTDQARGGNNQVGTVSYEANDTATGMRLAEGTVPISTATNYGFNFYYPSTSYSNFAFGARLSASKLTDVTSLITVGEDSGSVVTGVVSIGISAAGKWQARIFDVAGSVTETLTSTTSAAVNTETHVGLNLSYDVIGEVETIELRINGVAEDAVTIALPNLLQTNGHYVIGTREGVGYRPRVSEMFWTHDTLADEHWAYLHNGGAKRFYADFGNAPYGTTHDAFLASVMSAKAGAIYKLNSTLADSAPNSPLGAATVIGGAAFSSAQAAPVGFGADQVLAVDGVGDALVSPTCGLHNTFSQTASTWFYQTSAAPLTNTYSSSASYLVLGAPTGQPQSMIALAQVPTADSINARYQDASNVLGESVITPSRLNGWRMLTLGGHSGQYIAPMMNGIVMGKPYFYNATVNLRPDGVLSVAGRPDGTDCIAGYISRAFVVSNSNLSLPDLAKLYDLGMGSS